MERINRKGMPGNARSEIFRRSLSEIGWKKALRLYLGLFKNANFYRLQCYIMQAVTYSTMYYLII